LLLLILPLATAQRLAGGALLPSGYRPTGEMGASGPGAETRLSPANEPAEDSATAAPVIQIWHLEPVDAPKLFSNMGPRSLALDAAGRPHIAYGQDHLYYARHDGSTWHVEVVDNAEDVGAFTSLALDAAGRPHISYRDVTNGALKYAAFDGAAWQIEVVESGLGASGGYTSLALDAAGQPHISYPDVANGDLKYAYADRCMPVEVVEITGPPALPVGRTGNYGATVQPITASVPLSFTWDNGTVGPTAIYSWT
jgi:hypothetical protein